MPTLNVRTGPRVLVRLPTRADAPAFLRAMRASRSLHANWVKGPSTRTQFDNYLERFSGRLPTHAGMLVVRRSDGALAGVINISEIVRGAFQSAYIGYYAFAGLAGEGYMREGMGLALDAVFRDLKLHRVEVNVQPTNERSIALVEKLRFAREGYSRRYVKIGGRWRDHIRFALLAEDWRTRRGRTP